MTETHLGDGKTPFLDTKRERIGTTEVGVRRNEEELMSSSTKEAVIQARDRNTSDSQHPQISVNLKGTKNLDPCVLYMAGGN